MSRLSMVAAPPGSVPATVPATMTGMVVVLKVGGMALDDHSRRAVLAAEVNELRKRGVSVVIVHGGGPQISEEMELRGLVPTFSDGRRITDDMTLAVIERVLLGVLSPALIASLTEAGVDALSLTGTSGGLLTARRVDELGHVGEITSVRRDILTAVLELGLTPVVACLARSSDGGTLNVNADEVAAAIAVSLAAHKLLYVTDVPGILSDRSDPASLFSLLDSQELEGLLPELGAGMVPKARSALHALRGGVDRVHILEVGGPHDLLSHVIARTPRGTQVTL